MQNKFIYNFNAEKNAWLMQARGISFEQIIAVLDNKGPLDVIEHPNEKQYGHQKIYVVELEDYIYLVPFVEEKNGTLFLKTAFPNRKANKEYAVKRGKS